MLINGQKLFDTSIQWLGLLAFTDNHTHRKVWNPERHIILFRDALTWALNDSCCENSLRPCYLLSLLLLVVVCWDYTLWWHFNEFLFSPRDNFCGARGPVRLASWLRRLMRVFDQRRVLPWRTGSIGAKLAYSCSRSSYTPLGLITCYGILNVALILTLAFRRCCQCNYSDSQDENLGISHVFKMFFESCFLTAWQQLIAPVSFCIYSL